MKTRGWLVAAAFMAASVIAPGYAMASEATSQAGDVLGHQMDKTERAAFVKNITAQNQIANDIANKIGLTGQKAEQVKKTVSATRGTFFPAANSAFYNLMNLPMTRDVAPMAAGDPPAMLYSLDMLFNDFDPDTGEWLNSYGITGDEYMAVLNTADGYSATAGAVSGLRTIEANSSLIHRHQKDIRGDMRTALSQCAPGFVSRIWASPFHTNMTQRAKDGFEGYKYKMTGVSVGYDLMAGPVNIGAAFTYSKGDFEWRDASDDNKIHNYGGSLYAQYYTTSGFFAAVDAGYNYGKNKWNRYLSGLAGIDDITGWERGRNHTKSYWVGGTLGYDFKTSSGFTVTPTVGLQWEHAKSSAYTTSMDGDPFPVYMDNGSFKQKSLLLPIEITAAYDRQISDCSKISLRATAGYTYNFKNKGAKGWVNQAGMADEDTYMEGMKSARSRWNAGVGINYNYKNFDIGVDYQFEGAKKYKDHSVSATVGVRF